LINKAVSKIAKVAKHKDTERFMIFSSLFLII